MLIYETQLDVTPGGKKSTVQLTQYSDDLKIVFFLYTESGEFEIEENTSAFIRGTKPDGNGFSADAVSVDATKNTVTISGDKQLTAVAGNGTFEIVLVSSDEKELCTANFSIRVQGAALDKDTPVSTSKLREFVMIEDNYDAIITAGEQYAAYQQAISGAQTQLQNTVDLKTAEIQTTAATEKAAILQTASEAQASALSSLSATQTQIIANMHNQFDVSAIQAAADIATAKATEAKKRASNAATYAANAERSANNAAASARKAATGSSYADDAQTSAAKAAASANLAAEKAEEILALEIGRRSGLSVEEVTNILTQLVQERVSTLNIPNDLTYNSEYLLQLEKDGVPVGDGVTVTGGVSSGSGSGTWGSMFGLS